VIHKNVFAVEGNPSVIGTGLVALDVVLNGKVTVPRLFAGGTCGNVLTVLAWLGWKAFPVARLGADDAGRRVSTDLRRWGVHLDVARLHPRAPTPIIIERLEATGDGRPQHRFSLNCPVCGSWLPRYQPVTIEAAKHALHRRKLTSVFFFDRASRGALKLASVYEARGALIFYEPSGQASEELFNEALELAHICKYSAEQFESFRWKGSKRPFLEVQTMGDKGVRYRSCLPLAAQEDWQFTSASPVGVLKDSAGAGDWFSAGLIHVLGQKGVNGFKTTTTGNLRSALTLAKTIAAWSCQFEGPRGGMYAVRKAEFRKQIRFLLAGEQLPGGTARKLRSARLTNFRCPVSSCCVGSL